MKLRTIAAIILVCCVHLSHSQTVKLITYNIRFDNPEDGLNSWSARKEYLMAQLDFYEPDVFGIQEGLSHQVGYLDSCLKEYRYVGVGRDDGMEAGEYCAVFYKADRFEPVSQSTFWLSESKEKPSRGWDASMKRICTHVLLQDLYNGNKIWIFNTHFDHIGRLARKNSARLIINQINTLNKENFPVVLMGDLNLEPDNEAIQYISGIFNDAKHASTDVVFGPDGTFNGFEFSKPVSRRIDYIFTDKSKIRVNKYAILSDSRDCRYPSDHLPVYVEVLLENQE